MYCTENIKSPLSAAYSLLKGTLPVRNISWSDSRPFYVWREARAGPATRSHCDSIWYRRIYVFALSILFTQTMQYRITSRMTVNNELDRTWKKVAMAYFNVLSRHSPGGTYESRKITQDSLSWPRFEASIPEYVSRVNLLNQIALLIWMYKFLKFRNNESTS